MSKVLLMYIPVPHAGYLVLIRKLAPSKVLVVSDEIAEKFDKRRKDLRANKSSEIVLMLKSVFPELDIGEFGADTVFDPAGVIHMPIEDISEAAALESVAEELSTEVTVEETITEDAYESSESADEQDEEAEEDQEDSSDEDEDDSSEDEEDHDSSDEE